MFGPRYYSSVGHLAAGLDHVCTEDKIRPCTIVIVHKDSQNICLILIHLAEVWEKEFDPIMVVLRTVYRRDVQSAMDRYGAL